MKKILKILLAILPVRIRFHLIRKMVNITHSLEQENIQVQVATEKEDFERAFQLLHDCYVGSGLMDPHPSGLRCNSYSFLPHTAIIVLKREGRVIGTVSLIRDSSMGLPSDEKYKDQNDSLRTQGRILTEVSALAIDPEFRNQGHILNLMLMKFLYNYSKKHSDTDCLVCTVHPRAENFYRALWGFERRGRVVSYGYVKGALAVFLSLELSEANEKRILATYKTDDPQRNLALYCLLEDQRLIYPTRMPGQIVSVRMSPEILNYFFQERTNLFHELSPIHRQIFIEIYYFYFKGRGIEEYFQVHREYRIREYRTPTRIQGQASFGDATFQGEILDLSPSGCFITTSFLKTAEISLGDKIQIDFSLGPKPYRLTGKCRWKNSSGNERYPAGIGIQFDAQILSLRNELEKWGAPEALAKRPTA